MGQQLPSGMDHPAFNCMTQLYLADKKNRVVDLCRQENLTQAEFNELLQHLLPKCSDADWNTYRRSTTTTTLTVPHHFHPKHYQVSIVTVPESAPLPPPSSGDTVYPNSLLLRHRDDLLLLAQQSEHMSLLRDQLTQDFHYDQLLVLRTKVVEHCQLIQRLEQAAGKEGPNEIPNLPELTDPDHNPFAGRTSLEQDMMFLHNRFEAAVGRCVMDTLTDLESVEHYEERKAHWKPVHDIMREVCEEGRQREPPVPEDILTYYMSA